AIHDDTNQVIARVAELQSAVTALLEERNQLVQCANNFQSLLSPIRRFPPELLMVIFQHACAESVWGIDAFNVDLKQTRWMIPHVCREWRRVALSCPPLW
ncbi:hypothetical protein CPB85DRAFT_1171372, partial [Mucidula mucida]